MPVYRSTPNQSRRRNALPLAVALAVALLAAPAVRASDFSLFGSYWDTDVAGDAAGGGVGFNFAFNEILGLDLRASYYEELSDDPFQNAFDSDDPVFQEQGINVMPVEAGLRFSFARDSRFRPYVSGGASYLFIDSDFGEIDDELGYYAALGASMGDPEGANFFVEGLWRKVTAQVELDPEELDDIDDLEVDDTADLDLDGFGVNLGVRWSF